MSTIVQEATSLSTELRGAVVSRLPLKGRLLTVVQPETPNASLAAWARERKSEVNSLLLPSRALLFRGWRIDGTGGLDAVTEALARKPWEGVPFILAKRHKVGGGVYTSTDWPAEFKIGLHNELSNNPYKSWPQKICFYCEIPPVQGGQTPIADNVRIFERIDKSIREEFMARGVMYHRTLQEGFVSWQEMFGTDDLSLVEARCRAADIEFEWGDGRRALYMHWRLHAVARHPVTRQRVWFNGAHTAARHRNYPALLDETGRPVVDATFGDGRPIPESMLGEIEKVLDAEEVLFDWQTGDLLLLDNMLATHGRRAFSGDRRILVTMMDPVEASAAEVS